MENKAASQSMFWVGFGGLGPLRARQPLYKGIYILALVRTWPKHLSFALPLSPRPRPHLRLQGLVALLAVQLFQVIIIRNVIVLGSYLHQLY